MNIATYIVSHLFGSKYSASIKNDVDALLLSTIKNNPAMSKDAVVALVNASEDKIVGQALAFCKCPAIFAPILESWVTPPLDAFVSSEYDVILAQLTKV